ncbi:hypothetical protein D3C87_80850 [compost metagenome]
MSIFIEVANFYQPLNAQQIEELEYIEMAARMLDYNIDKDFIEGWIIFSQDEPQIFDVFFGKEDFSIVVDKNAIKLNEAQEKYKFQILGPACWFEHLEWKEFIDLIKMFL